MQMLLWWLLHVHHWHVIAADMASSVLGIAVPGNTVFWIVGLLPSHS